MKTVLIKNISLRRIKLKFAERYTPFIYFKYITFFYSIFSCLFLHFLPSLPFQPCLSFFVSLGNSILLISHQMLHQNLFRQIFLHFLRFLPFHLHIHCRLLIPPCLHLPKLNLSNLINFRIYHYNYGWSHLLLDSTGRSPFQQPLI